MKKIYLFTFALIISCSVFSQHFNKGFDLSFNDLGCYPRRDATFGKHPSDTVTYFTGGTTACAGGLKHLTKIKKGGTAQTILNLECGSGMDVDFLKYPYVTIRIKTTCAQDIQMTTVLRGGTHPYKTYTVKGGDVWQTIRLDYGDLDPLPGGTTNEMHTSFNEPAAGVTYPYEIYYDYIRFGHTDKRTPFNTGDPDSLITVSIDTLAAQICEKDAGEQSINLTGISNGTDVALLSLSQTNTKTTIFEGTPAFTAIQPDGTATLNYTPKAGTVGVSTVHLVLKYNRADTVVKYKSIWFNINIIADPTMKVVSSVKAQVNQPKVIMNVTSAVNSTGGASGLSIAVSSTNTALITNLIADPVKPDGTSKISFIPGQDLCNTDVITAVITDALSGRTATYEIAVEVSSATCVPVDTSDAIEDAKKTELSVVPNPSSDVITITLPDNKGGKLIIVDMTGIKVKEIVVPAGQTVVSNISIAQLTPGVYFISLDSKNGSKKLIVR